MDLLADDHRHHEDGGEEEEGQQTMTGAPSFLYFGKSSRGESPVNFDSLFLGRIKIKKKTGDARVCPARLGLLLSADQDEAIR
jgi:hypothetical protein